jgi:hypothetical protein
LIPYKSLILPLSRESAKIRARPYSSGAHRPCSAKAITPKRTVLVLVGVAPRFLSRLNRRIIMREDVYNVRSYLRFLLLLGRNLSHFFFPDSGRCKA